MLGKLLAGLGRSGREGSADDDGLDGGLGCLSGGGGDGDSGVDVGGGGFSTGDVVGGAVLGSDGSGRDGGEEEEGVGDLHVGRVWKVSVGYEMGNGWVGLG